VKDYDKELMQLKIKIGRDQKDEVLE
jgi:hypothetical protein